jgi:hypothetical protein
MTVKSDHTITPSLWSKNITIKNNSGVNIKDNSWIADNWQAAKISANDIDIDGRNLTEVLKSIEQRLAILKPNADLEHRWEELKKLGDQYRKLEKEILAQEGVWDTLKK